MSEYLDLYDYRRRVADMYRERLRDTLGAESAVMVLQHFREVRDELFAKHRQSALDEGQGDVALAVRHPEAPACRPVPPAALGRRRCRQP